MSTQAIVDRIARKKQELAALRRIQALSESTDAHCMELNRQMSKVVQQYAAMLAIAKGWSNAFESAVLVDVPQSTSTDDDSEQPESVIRIPVESDGQQ
ncbi:hypothetical protein EC988_002482 [Linderina pennispora]|nr:hypothetical protein EC988_002482 [Linderina pennispora]